MRVPPHLDTSGACRHVWSDGLLFFVFSTICRQPNCFSSLACLELRCALLMLSAATRIPFLRDPPLLETCQSLIKGATFVNAWLTILLIPRSYFLETLEHVVQGYEPIFYEELPLMYVSHVSPHLLILTRLLRMATPVEIFLIGSFLIDFVSKLWVLSLHQSLFMCSGEGWCSCHGNSTAHPLSCTILLQA